MIASRFRRTVAAVVAEELADALDWRRDGHLQIEAFARMTDQALLRYLHDQAAGYPVEVLELIRRFDRVRVAQP